MVIPLKAEVTFLISQSIIAQQCFAALRGLVCCQLLVGDMSCPRSLSFVSFVF